MLFLLSFIFLRGEGSTNGKLYVCDGQTTTEAAGTYCVFAIDESECSTDDSLDCLTAPLEGNSLVDITQQGLGGAMVAGSNGMQMGVSPRPWTEGDQLVTAPSAVSGDDWANALAFSMVAPLRNKMMMTPWEVYPQDQWELYTNAFTDCMIKLVDGEANDLSSTNVHAQLNQATDGGPVHTPLQYLEEAAIDLVCLMTDLDMSGSRRLLSDDRCAAIREVWGIQSGTRCDCWTDAYVAMFGSEPEVEQGFFSDCSVVGTPTVPTETDSGSDDSDSGTGGGSTSGPTCCDGSTAACADGSSMPCSSGAPVCADGSNALQPGTECPSDDPATEEPEPICEDGDEDTTNPCQPLYCEAGEWSHIIVDCAEQMGMECLAEWMPAAEGECCSSCPCDGSNGACTPTVCSDGSNAPVPPGECCGDMSLCPTTTTTTTTMPPTHAPTTTTTTMTTTTTTMPPTTSTTSLIVIDDGYVLPDFGLLDSMVRMLTRDYTDARLIAAGQRAAALLQAKDEDKVKLATLYDPAVKGHLQKIRRFFKADESTYSEAVFNKQRVQYNKIAEIVGRDLGAW